MFFLKNYRLKLHEKIPCLTPEELETISLYALDREESATSISEEEYEKIGKEIDFEIARLAWEHDFDDVKEIHEAYPYLTPEECRELKECKRKVEPYEDNALGLIIVLKELKRGMELEYLNNYRKKNEKNVFD